MESLAFVVFTVLVVSAYGFVAGPRGPPLGGPPPRRLFDNPFPPPGPSHMNVPHAGEPLPPGPHFNGPPSYERMPGPPGSVTRDEPFLSEFGGNYREPMPPGHIGVPEQDLIFPDQPKIQVPEGELANLRMQTNAHRYYSDPMGPIAYRARLRPGLTSVLNTFGQSGHDSPSDGDVEP